MSLLPSANSGRPRRERITLMLRFTRRDIAINQRGSKSEHYPSAVRVPEFHFDMHRARHRNTFRAKRERTSCLKRLADTV